MNAPVCECGHIYSVHMLAYQDEEKNHCYLPDKCECRAYKEVRMDAPEETIDMTLGWSFAATVLAMNLLDGSDYETRSDSAREVEDMGRMLQFAIDFIKGQGLTREFVETLPVTMRNRYVRVSK